MHAKADFLMFVYSYVLIDVPGGGTSQWERNLKMGNFGKGNFDEPSCTETAMTK